MLVASNVTIQFGAKPLFENVSVKFGEGNRYGLIGANGSGKTTFMKILAGVLESTAGNVSLDPGERMAYLKQDQFAYEDMRVLDVVMMGHAEMWACMSERDAIYANPEATEDDYMRAADLEHHYAEYGGYTAEARAGELLLGAGIPTEKHGGPMSEVAPGWKLRVLLVQALFANPDILLLDEPTNNLDIDTIRWLEDILNERESTMVIISHDRHFLNQVCTHMADLDYGTIKVYGGNYDDFMEASTVARERQVSANAKAKERIADLQGFVRRFSANKSKAKQATSRLKLIEKIRPEDIKPSSRQYPWIRFEYDEKEKLHRLACEIENLGFGYEPKTPIIKSFSTSIEAGDKVAIIGENGVGKTTLLRLLAGPELGRPGTAGRPHQVGGKGASRGLPPGPRRRLRIEDAAHRVDRAMGARRRLRGRRRRDPGARHPGPPAVLRRRSEEAGQCDLRWRAGPHAVRQADAAAKQRAADGRADQPSRHGIDRVAQHRAGKIQRHADLRLARPRVRVLAGDAHHRHPAGSQHRRLPRQLRRVLV
jgi:ATPase subunit of ABC transporter with duplicated ATPase domains